MKTSLQQCWVDPDQTGITEIIAMHDVFQGPLTEIQMAAVRKINPDIILLPFDSMMEPGQRARPANSGERPSELWLADPEDFGSGQRVFWDVGDDCTKVGGQTYRRWKVEDALGQLGGLPYDGIYLDLWHVPWQGLFPMPRMTEGEYIDGMNDLADELRRAWRRRYGNEPVIIANPAKTLNFSYSLNGFMWEDFPTFCWPPTAQYILQGEEDWVEHDTGPAERRGGPVVLIINIRARDYDQGDPRFWQSMRYATGLSLLGDNLYVMFNSGWGGSPHWASPWWFDEWSVELGESEGKAARFPNGVWYRAYSRGLILLNDTEEEKEVTDRYLREHLPSYKGPYFRFRGGQQPRFNDGFPVGDGEGDRIHLGVFWRGEGEGTTKRIGDAVILLKDPQTVVSPIYIDDTSCHPPTNIQGDFETNGMKVFTQEGLSSFCDNHFDPFPDAWRSFPRDTAHYTPPGEGLIFARWTPRIGVAGRYEVYAWFPSRVHSRVTQREGFSSEDIASRALYRVHHAGGTDIAVVNQRAGGGGWVSLGTYSFEEGRSGYIELTDEADGYVIADAVKLVFRASSHQCSGDLNGDGEVDVMDLQILINVILGGHVPIECSDINDDGLVDVVDLQLMVNKVLNEA